LQIAGTLAVLAELLIQSFGLLSVAAVGFFAASYYIVFKESPTAIIILIIINLFSLPITLIFGVKKLRKTNASLNESVEGEGFVAPAQVGEIGVALTDLRPAGTAKIRDKHIDVYSEGEYVLKGARIKVVSTENAGVKVAAVSDANYDGSDVQK